MSLPSIEQVLLSQPRKRRDSRVSDMDLNTLLNTNRHALAAGGRSIQMQYEIPPSFATQMNHDMSSAQQQHYGQQSLYVPPNSRIKTETGSDRGASPHTSEQSSRYSSQTPQNNIAYQQMANQLSNGINGTMQYPSEARLPPGTMPMIQHSYHPNAPADQSYQQAQLGAVQQPVQHDQQSMDGTPRNGSLPKAFACSTCSKGFARRSDLARHGKLTPSHFY